MTTPEQIAAVEKLGYDPQDARFLPMAALLSGYFLRRQYLAFVGGSKGSKDVAFLERLEANRHCQVIVCRHGRMVYHLSGKGLYVALGDPDNRNRREHQPMTIKNRVMGIDFVLSHPGEYLATEKEKLEYFAGQLKIATTELPTRWYESPRGAAANAKHFADKYPMYLAVPPGANKPVVHFCYVDEGTQLIDRFRTYLKQYLRLFVALGDFRVIYAAESARLFDRARRVFNEVLVKQPVADADAGARTDRVVDYFEMRRDYEAKDYSQFDTGRLIEYRNARSTFGGEIYEALYRAWSERGLPAIEGTLGSGRRVESVEERFSTYILNQNYELFGTLTRRREEKSVGTEAQTHKELSSFEAGFEETSNNLPEISTSGGRAGGRAGMRERR